ncbi:MAG TPA: ZPR1 zinc finger domain-containing protein [Thermofilum sp.]|nr:ZPR1 zinc finger domain-containing protein [Thermofilum sp.]
MERISEYVEEVYEFKETCPICGYRDFTIKEAVYNVPNIGRLLIVTKLCPSCGFRRVEELPLTKKRRKRIYYKVNKRDDIYAKVIRSNMASVEIVEIDSSISPGLQAPLYVTNVEGIVHKFLDILKSMEVLSVSKERKEHLVRIKKRLERMLKPSVSYTLIIDDPLGVSNIIPLNKQSKVLIEEVEGELTTYGY